MIKKCRIILTIAIFISLASIAPCEAWCADEEALPDEAAVAAAIKAMFADPLSPKAVDLGKKVMDYSQGSDKVRVVVARDLGFYPGSDYSDMLLTHYIAGVVKFDLENPEKASDELLGIQSGLQASLNAYKKIRIQRPSLAVPGLDAFEASLKKGEMNVFITEALARVRQDRVKGK